MRKYFVLFLCMTTILLLSLCFVMKPAQAADYSVTFGAPFLVGAEFEGRISDQFSYCVDGSYYWMAGADITAVGVGGKWYFAGETMNGVYLGTQIGSLHGSGKFLGIIDMGGDDAYGQVKLGYKKVTSSGFTYDVGIYGLCYDDMDGVDGGVSFGLGYAW